MHYHSKYDDKFYNLPAISLDIKIDSNKEKRISKGDWILIREGDRVKKGEYTYSLSLFTEYSVPKKCSKCKKQVTRRFIGHSPTIIGNTTFSQEYWYNFLQINKDADFNPEKVICGECEQLEPLPLN